MLQQQFLTMIRPDGDIYRFVIRDRTGRRPSIHGSGRSIAEALAKMQEIMQALEVLEQQQRAA
ncbi:MAG: hypothetical protein ACXVZX_09740 [Terriglobales bacterium]